MFRKFISAKSVTASSLALLAIIVFLTDAAHYSSVFLSGVSLWARSVLPAIFPLMFFSKILSESNGFSRFFGKRRLFAKWTNSPAVGAYLFVLSALCGYPVGAKLISEQHTRGASKTQCLKFATYCSTAGVGFLFFTVGARLQNATAVLLLVVSHFAANFLNGLLYRNAFVDLSQNPTPEQSADNILGTAALDSALSVLTVGGLIAVFYLLSDMICRFLPAWFSSDGQPFTAYLLGLLEMTNGCIMLCNVTDTFTATVLCCSLVSFGGLCVLLQCGVFLGKCGIKTGAIALFKASHCALATILCFLLGKLFL